MKWNKGYNVPYLLNRISDSRTVQSDGSYTLGFGSNLDRLVAILAGAISDDDTSDALKRRAVRTAMASRQQLDQPYFEKSYREAVRKHREASKRFHVAFPIWGHTELLVGRVKVDDCTIELQPKKEARRYRAIEAARKAIVKEHGSLFSTIFVGVDTLPLTIVQVTAFSQAEAQEIAYAAMTEYLGALAFFDDQTRGKLTWSGLQQPLSQLLIGPFITVHDLDGGSSYQGFYYGTWLPKPFAGNPHSQEDIAKLTNAAKRLHRSAKKSPWSKKARRALSLYHDAFSDHDRASAFLSGWRVLELIGGGKETGYDVLVERAARRFEERKDYLILGKYLRDRRNLITHTGKGMSGDREDLAYQLKTFIMPLFKMYVGNSFGFKSEGEFWAFCDLSHDSIERERQSYALRRARRYFGDDDSQAGNV